MKGRGAFVIPGCLRNRNASIRVKRVPKEGDQAVETEEHGRRAVDRKVGPLTLRCGPQVGPALLKSRFQTPVFHECPHDLLRSLRLVRRKQRFGWPSPLRITREHPADGQRVQANTIPQRGPSADLQGAFSLPIQIQGEPLPRRLRIDQDLFERGKTLANHPRTR